MKFVQNHALSYFQGYWYYDLYFAQFFSFQHVVVQFRHLSIACYATTAREALPTITVVDEKTCHHRFRPPQAAFPAPPLFANLLEAVQVMRSTRQLRVRETFHCRLHLPRSRVRSAWSRYRKFQKKDFYKWRKETAITECTFTTNSLQPADKVYVYDVCNVNRKCNHNTKAHCPVQVTASFSRDDLNVSLLFKHNQELNKNMDSKPVPKRMTDTSLDKVQEGMSNYTIKMKSGHCVAGFQGRLSQ